MIKPIVAAVFFVLSVVAGPTFAQTKTVGMSLLEMQSNAVRTGGSLRVIVEFTEPDITGLQGLATPAAVDRATTAAIRSRQADILSDIFGVDRARTLAGNAPATLMDFVPMMAISASADQIGRLAADPRVVRIYEDRLEKAFLKDSVKSIGMLGTSGAYAKGATGVGRAVAIIDSGVNKNNEFLKGKVVSEACFSTTDAANRSTSLCPGGAASSTGFNSGLDCSTAIEGCGHGTHVAGIAAGRNTSLSTGEPGNGVAKAAAIVAIKVFSRIDDATVCGTDACIRAFNSDTIKALNRVYALRGGVSNRKIDAVNMSIGGGGTTGFCDGSNPSIPKDPRTGIIRMLKSAGIVTVIASGNDGFINGVTFPGCIGAAVTVGATTKFTSTRQEYVTFYSNQGPQVDLLAPGGDYGWPFETNRDLIKSSFGKVYKGLPGTSMAAPHVAGAIAAIRSRAACRGKSVDAIVKALKSTGPLITDLKYSPAVAKERRLNVPAAITALGC